MWGILYINTHVPVYIYVCVLYISYSHKYNDFWDQLVKDVNHIVKKADGEEDEEDGEEEADLFSM